MSKVTKVVISSSPKLFEPVLAEDAGNTDAWAPLLTKLLDEHKGAERGDLVSVLACRELDGNTSGVRLPDGRTVNIQEWFITVLLRWTGTAWECVFPGGLSKGLCL